MTMSSLNPGKFYLLREGHNLWQTDKIAANHTENKAMIILLPGTMVMFAGFGKFRYLRVVFEEQIGYIWCNTNIPVFEHMELVTTEEHVEELQKSIKERSGRKRRWRSEHRVWS